jgi:hypothetical protein
MKAKYKFPEKQERLWEVRKEAQIRDLVIKKGYTVEEAEKKVYRMK